MTHIRAEHPDDAEAVRDVNDAAFGGTDESALIERLRESGDIITALVAVEDGEIVGHIVFSKLKIVDSEHKTEIRAAALAPMAVAPTHQRLGIGSALVRQGIENCKELGIEAIAVLGHERFYPRFGFSAEKAECLKSPFSGPFFMILPLKDGIFDDFSGIVIYPDAFEGFSEQ